MDKQTTVIEMTKNNVKLLTGYEEKNKLYVMQCLEGENLPLQDGIVKKEDLKESLTALLAKARTQLKMELGPLVFLYPPIGFETEEISENTVTGNKENLLSVSEYNSCNIRALKRVKKPDKISLYLAPYNFKVDNSPSMPTFSIGMVTKTFEMDGDVHLLDKNTCSIYQEAINALGLKPCLEMVSTYCASEFLNGSMEPNYLLVELEKDYTYLSFVKGKRLIASLMLQENLDSIIKRFCQTLSISEERAEDLIQTFGFLPKFEFDYETDEGYDLKTISSTLLNSFLPLLNEIKEKTTSWNTAPEIPLIITGVGRQIYGISNCFKMVLKRDARLSTLRVLGAKPGVYDALLGAIHVANLPYQLAPQYQKSQYDSELKSTIFNR